MKVKSLNKNVEQYGYQDSFEYKSKNFHGHQIAIPICIVNKNNKIIENYLPKKELINTLLEDKNIVFFTEEEVKKELDNSNFQLRKVYYLPYYVENHSMFMPTVRYRNTNKKINKTIELFFCKEHNEKPFCRSIVLTIKNTQDSLCSLVNAIFLGKIAQQELQQQFYEIVFETKIILDFYDEIGNMILFKYDSLNELKEDLYSFRFIDLEEE